MNEISADVMAGRGTLYWLRPSRPASLKALGTWRLTAVGAAGLAFAQLCVATLLSRPGQVFYLSPAVSGPAAIRDLLAWLVACLGRWRVVVHLHTGAVDELLPPFLTRTLGPALKRTEAIVLLEQFAEPIIAIGLSVSVVHNGVSCTASSHCPTLRSSTQLEAVFLGNMIPSKGVDTVVATFHQLLDEGDEEWHLTFAGTEPHERSASLDALVSRARGRVRVLGTVDREQRCALLRDANVLLFPSRYALEGSPLVILEALQHGVQPWVSRWAGLVATAGAVGRVSEGPLALLEGLRDYKALPICERHLLARQCRDQWRSGWTEQHYRLALADVLSL